MSVDGARCLWMVLCVCGWCYVSVDGAMCLWMVLGVCGWCTHLVAANTLFFQ